MLCTAMVTRSPGPEQCERMDVMWADESVYGPPAPGCKVGDFIMTWFMCTPKAAKKLITMDFENLTVKEATIVG